MKFFYEQMYILGGDATIKMKRHLHSGPPPRTKTSVMKYIYFQEGAVLFFLVFICMGCIYLDLYNAGFEVRISSILKLYVC